MPFELDHVFLAVSRGAPEVGPLGAAGFTEGPPNTHPGQGTACRRIFFDDAYLELVWLEDLAEASSPLIEPTGLARRAGGAEGASRVGFCLRTSEAGGDLPVRTWAYRPPYLPKGTSLPIAANSSVLREPLIFFLPTMAGRSEVDRIHPNGARTITDVALALPGLEESSPELRWLAGSGCVRVEAGARESLRLELDRGVQGGFLRLDTPTPLEVLW